jgi:iron complex transport system substrate-binding protein
VKNAWQEAEDVVFHSKIDTIAPPKRIIAMSSSHAAMLEAVGCANRIVGLSGCNYIYSPTISQAVESGEICEVGYDTNFDLERIALLEPDVILLYGVAGKAEKITNKLDEIGIPYIYIGDYLESNPLGRAEWVVALATICGVEEEGKAFFADVERRYNSLCSQVENVAKRPRVMLNLPYCDTWFMPSHNSYIVRLIEDAGGEYVLRQEATDAQGEGSSKPISLEEALDYAMQADFWLNLGQTNSIAELHYTAPHFINVDAVRHGRIYNNTKRTNGFGGSDFWESGAIRPDFILEDLVKILHYEVPTDSLYYYKKLE